MNVDKIVVHQLNKNNNARPLIYHKACWMWMSYL